MSRDSWSSRIGFIFAVAGSAIGLGNIWRFPYITGEYGGAAFIAVYIICTLLIGFPVLIAEILMGRSTQTSPSGAFRRLGGTKWSWVGKMTILTGFIVSSFYSAVAGWILGYLIEAIKGNITNFYSTAEAVEHYSGLIVDPWWTLGFHFAFISLSTLVLLLGVRSGIERGNKIMMPLLFILLLFLVLKGLTMEKALQGLKFLFAPDWSVLTPKGIMVALGQSFFALSLGQGTMVTYGSYLGKKDNLVKNCIPIVIMDTLVAIFAAMAVFTIVFSTGHEPNSGPGLIFHTLPVAFSQIPGGIIFAIGFFLLVVLAALTSEISAMEPAIAYLRDERGWKRSSAVIIIGFSAFLLGIPSALSFSVASGYTLFGKTFLDIVDFLSTSILVPLGGLGAALLVGWVWGIKNALIKLKEGAEEYFLARPWLSKYLDITIKFVAPLLIIFVFLHALAG